MFRLYKPGLQYLYSSKLFFNPKRGTGDAFDHPVVSQFAVILLWFLEFSDGVSTGILGVSYYSVAHMKPQLRYFMIWQLVETAPPAVFLIEVQHNDYNTL